MYRHLLLINGLILIWVLLASGSVVNPYMSMKMSQLRNKVPRIGRRGQGIVSEYMESDTFPREGSLSNFFLKSSKAVPRLGRRKDLPANELEMTMLENYLRRRLNVPDLSEDGDDDGLDDQLHAFSSLWNDATPPDESKMNSDTAHELVQKWWPVLFDNSIKD